MCIVSMIADDWLKRTVPSWTQPNTTPNTTPNTFPNTPFTFNFPNVTREEFESLKKEVQELSKLLKAAKEYDTATGQPDCETDEKTAILKKIAEYLEVDLPI